MNVRRTAMLSIIVGAGVIAPAAGSAAASHVAASKSTGAIKVHLTDPSKMPVPDQKFCPTSTKASPTKPDKKMVIVGKCATTNAHGSALLKNVTTGHRYATLYTSDGRPYVSKAVTVKKGKTATVRWSIGG